jgi:hypothetical protein
VSCVPGARENKFKEHRAAVTSFLTALPFLRTILELLLELSALKCPSAMAKFGSLKVNLTSDCREMFLRTESIELS